MSSQTWPERAALPPWNSHDSFSWIISKEFLTNAEMIANQLKSKGYEVEIFNWLTNCFCNIGHFYDLMGGFLQLHCNVMKVVGVSWKIIQLGRHDVVDNFSLLKRFLKLYLVVSRWHTKFQTFIVWDSCARVAINALIVSRLLLQVELKGWQLHLSFDTLSFGTNNPQSDETG